MTPVLALLAAAVASAVRSPWVFVAEPWRGFTREFSPTLSVDVFWDPEFVGWHVRACGPEVEGDAYPIPGEWWDALATVDAIIEGRTA